MFFLFMPSCFAKRYGINAGGLQKNPPKKNKKDFKK